VTKVDEKTDLKIDENVYKHIFQLVPLDSIIEFCVFFLEKNNFELLTFFRVP
jgi:hypothetical protein